MQKKVWLTNRSVRSLERDLLEIVPAQCSECKFPETVINKALMNYRTGIIKRREAIKYMTGVVNGIDECSGLSDNLVSPAGVRRCGLVPVAEMVEIITNPVEQIDDLPADEACA